MPKISIGFLVLFIFLLTNLKVIPNNLVPQDVSSNPFFSKKFSVKIP